MINRGNNVLWYREGARNWNEALPLGNGRLGAMVYGNAMTERVGLNEDTLWSGNPSFYENDGAIEAYREARDLAMKGEYERAQTILEQRFTGLWSQVYLALGDLIVTMSHDPNVTNYRRALDMSEGLHTVEYAAGGVNYRRETFVSHPDQVLVMRFTADRAKALTFSVSLSPALDASISMTNDAIGLRGNCPSYVWHYGDPQQPRGKIEYGQTDEEKGMGYYALLRVVTEGGAVERRGGGLYVSGADSATLIFDVRTSFNGWDKHPVLEGKPYIEPCAENVVRAASKCYDDLKRAHIADHKALYDRVDFALSGGEEQFLPTDERLYRHDEGKSDQMLYALLFNYGRYLTIAGSREGTQAMNLQGIWNGSITPPWNSNYTININTEMNYWPTLMVNLPECHEPIVRLVEELSVSGARTAQRYYGAPGFVAHHNTDLWRLSTPVGAHTPGCAVFAFWPMGSGWLTRALWERYEYMRDDDWLREKGYPIIRQAAEFYLALLIDDQDGKLILAPATSPENGYRLNGKALSVAASTAMTQAILMDVFDFCLKSADILKLDDDFTARVRAARPRLKGFDIGRDGELMEWNENFEENEIHHRHISHLYGLHPGRSITPETTPELVKAVKRSLERRGDESTGWAMGWRICQWARLRDGDHALRLIDNQLRTVGGRNPRAKGRDGDGVNMRNGGGTYLNLLDAHPPFQIDGNFGACTGIAEMLLQSDEDGTIHPLAALPQSWTCGRVTGLRTRAGDIVDISWGDGWTKVEKRAR